MSLFKVCQWWSQQCSDISKSYDSFSLNCCRLHFDNMEKDCIVVTSHNGFLGIYRPTSERLDDGQITGFQHSDVVLETTFPLPVIGFCSGRFSHSAKDTKPLLAVLHPMKLAVYALATTDGIADHGDQTKLHVIYEHPLRKPAFSMCQGSFGGVKGREFLCVTHLDGSVKFFEQDGISYECKLPEDRHIPAAMIYVPRTDCFLTVSPGWDLECYRYQDLIEPEREGVPIWSMCLGEWALDYNVHQVANSESAIVILGENNLFCVSDTGKVKFIKRLDYAAVCFCSFVVGWYWEPGVRLMIAIVSENGSLLIYNDSALVWSARFENIPVCIGRANVHNLPGALITLGEEGLLNIGFLGTDPFLFKVPPLNLQEVDFEKTQQELLELEQLIQASLDFGDMASANKTADTDLIINVSVSPDLEMLAFPVNYSSLPGDDQARMALVSVTVRSLINLEHLQICYYVEAPMKCSTVVYVFRDVVANQQERLDTLVWVADLLPVPNLWLQVLFSFVSKQGIPRVVERRVMLPNRLVFKPVSMVKDAKFKTTLTIHGDNVNPGDLLSAVFKQLENPDEGQVLSVRNIYTSSVVTIAAAKNSSRLRIQSDSLLEMSSILDLVLNFLKTSFAEMCGDPKKRVTIHTGSQLYKESVMKTMDDYFTAWDKVKTSTTESTRKSAQFQLFERCSLKVKEKTTKDTEGIAALLERSNLDLIATKREAKAAERQLTVGQVHLSCILNFCRLVVQQLPVAPRISEAIAHAFVIPVNDWPAQSWSQALEPTIDQLTYSGPLRKNRQSTVYDGDFTYQPRRFDAPQFKRHFGAILEQTMQLAPSKQQNQQRQSSSEGADDDGLTAQTDDDGESDKNANNNVSQSGEAERKQLSEWVNYEIPPTSRIINAASNSSGSNNNNVTLS